MKIVKPIYDVGVFAWENQAGQYPEHGKGIQYHMAITKKGLWVNCLLYYGDDLTLQGILNHYPFDFPPYQKRGSVNLQVRKDKRRNGIGTALLNEAIKRYKINLKRQEYTPLGSRFIKAFQSEQLKSNRKAYCSLK